MSESHDEIARAVDRTARSVDGVEDVYSARPLVTRAARRLIDAGAGAADGHDEPLALVRSQGDTLEITVSVAIAADSVAASAVAAAVAEAVHDIVDPLGASDAPPARVRVRVSRVLTGPGRGTAENTAR